MDKKIEIGVKGNSSTAANLIVSYSSNGSSWSQIEFYEEPRANTSSYTTVEANLAAGTYYIRIIGKGIFINSIIIKDPTVPILSVSPATNAAFGSLAADDTKIYTVSNIGSGTMGVTISNSNTTDFTISTTSMSGLTGGYSEDFTITFNHNNEDLGEKSATITITPSYDANAAVAITATAKAIDNNAPELSVSPDEDTNLGAVYSDDVTYTVTNTGTGLMTVNISSDNSDFVVSTETIENLAHGESEDFTVTYTFGATTEKLGVNSTNITITPTYDANDTKTYEVSATSNASFTLDEENASSPGYGTKEYLLVKYTPGNGWNTISMPFMLKNNTMNNMDIIFGEGWMAYTLSSYSNGTLTFARVSSKSTINNGVPYLVYIESAANHPNGVLLHDISTQGNTPNYTTKGDATFRGTYTTKTYNAETDVETPWYGVNSKGQIRKAGSGAYVKGYRAYFTGVSAPDGEPAVRMLIIDEDDTTDLGIVRMVDAEAKDVYTLTGQKVQKGRKGIYIVNGKKVVIK